MLWRLRSSMTMSRKSMLSSWSWSRRRTSGLTLLKFSPGAMSAMMSSTTFLQSSLVISSWWRELGGKPFNNQRGIYSQHPEGIIQNRVNFRNFPRLIQHEAGQRALRVEIVDVDRRVHDEV